MTLSIKLPAIITAIDYHELGGMADLLSGLSGKRVKHFEVGLNDSCLYTAVLYMGKRPLKKEWTKMLKDKGIEIVEC